MSTYDTALASDPEVAGLIHQELERQQTTLQLIASENFTSPAVLAASGSVLTNKYSEGYPGRRYYGGNQVIDEVEDLARDRATALFGADHANVQPHAGANANLAAYQALLEPGATILAMRLDHGGHLTHGSPASITSKIWRFVAYGVTPASGDEENPGEVIDFDQVAHMAKTEQPALIVAGSTAYPVGVADVVTLTTHKTLRGPRGGAILCREDLAKKIDSAVFPGLQGGPLEHVIAAKAVAFAEAARPEFRQYAAAVVTNAAALGRGLAGHGFRLVSGGTDNHLLLVDLRTFDADLTGKEAQEVLDRAGITLNRNTIPDNPRSPFVTSGLRLGTAAETTAGMGPGEMATVADLIARTLKARTDESEIAAVRSEVAELCAAFPPYPDLLG